MSNETTNTEEIQEEVQAEVQEQNQEQLDAAQQAKFEELLGAVLHNGKTALGMKYEHVEGQVVNQGPYGPVFIFEVKDPAGDVYACGFFLNELIALFQSNRNPVLWMSSFYVELMKQPGGQPLRTPPANEDEAKAIIDKILVPDCIAAIHEEYKPEEVHAGLDWNEDLGPVFEAGFPAIKEGNNVFAAPLHLLITHHLLNRDPSELILQALNRIQEEFSASQQQGEDQVTE